MWPNSGYMLKVENLLKENEKAQWRPTRWLSKQMAEVAVYGDRDVLGRAGRRDAGREENQSSSLRVFCLRCLLDIYQIGDQNRNLR